MYNWYNFKTVKSSDSQAIESIEKTLSLKNIFLNFLNISSYIISSNVILLPIFNFVHNLRSEIKYDNPIIYEWIFFLLYFIMVTLIIAIAYLLIPKSRSTINEYFHSIIKFTDVINRLLYFSFSISLMYAMLYGLMNLSSLLLYNTFRYDSELVFDYLFTALFSGIIFITVYVIIKLILLIKKGE